MVKAAVPHKCSICGYTGHNLRTCKLNNNKMGSNFIRLFGVKIKQGSRNLHPNHGQPWSEEEHQLFLTGLQALGNGQWKRIAQDYVTTRTPRQVGTHAQKYYLRLETPLERKMRRSIFDVRIEEPVIEQVVVDGNEPAVPNDQADTNLPEGHGPYPVSSSAASTVTDQIDEAINGSETLDLELRRGCETTLDLELRLG